MQRKMELFHIPPELLLMIFAYLSSKQLDAVALTCKLFSQLAFDPSLRQLYPPLDYSKREEEKDKKFQLDIESEHLVAMANDTLILINRNRISLLSLYESSEPEPTLLYQSQNKKPFDNSKSITAWTKISNHLFAFSLKNGIAYLWDIKSIQCIKKWKIPDSSRGMSCLLSTRQNVLLHSCGNTVYFWDLKDLKKDEPIKTITLSDDIKSFGEEISNIFVNEQDEFIIVTEDNRRIHIYNEKGYVKTIEQIGMSTQTLELLPNNKLVGMSKTNDGIRGDIIDFSKIRYQFCVLDLQTATKKRYIPQFAPPLKGCWNQYMGGKSQLINSNDLIAIIHDCSSNLCSVFGVNGEGITIWDPDTGRCITRLIDKGIRDFSFLPDRRMVSLGGKDGKELHIWHFEPLEPNPQIQDQPLNEKSSLPASFFNKKLHQAANAGFRMMRLLSRHHPDKGEDVPHLGN